MIHVSGSCNPHFHTTSESLHRIESGESLVEPLPDRP